MGHSCGQSQKEGIKYASAAECMQIYSWRENILHRRRRSKKGSAAVFQGTRQDLQKRCRRNQVPARVMADPRPWTKQSECCDILIMTFFTLCLKTSNCLISSTQESSGFLASQTSDFACRTMEKFHSQKFKTIF